MGKGIEVMGQGEENESKLSTEMSLESTEETDEIAVAKQPPPSPEPTANIISRLFFFWVFGLVWKGFRNPLEENDVWALNPKDSALTTAQKFSNVYSNLPRDKPRLVKSLFKISRSLLIYTGLLQLIVVTLTISSAFVTEQILINVSDVTAPVTPGYLWSLALFAVVAIRSLAESHFFIELNRASCKLRAAIQSVVYKKSLTLSSSARGQSSVGEISNLMQLDAEALGRFTNTIHSLWSAPLQMIVTIALLYDLIKVSSLIGFSFTILTIPLQAWITKRLMQLRFKSLLATDQRVKLTNEILQGVKAVKYYAWEKPFLGNVNVTREQELNVLRKSVVLRAVFVVLITAIPTIIPIITFTFYLVVFENAVNVAVIYTALILLTQLRSPLLIIPFAVTGFVEAKISVKRLEKFLGFEDQHGEIVTSEQCEPGAITIERGTFSWERSFPSIPSRQALRKQKQEAKKAKKEARKAARRGKKEKDSTEEPTTPANETVNVAEEVPEEKSVAPVLNDINVTFPAGKLTAIVGPVGSGKSSLCNAILGEMNAVDGIVRKNGSIGYVPQTAWIFNGSLRENILFGSPYDEDKYNTAVEVSELASDIAILPQGHDTMIGEKGVNLSGGQKQRVSIARSVYSDLDIYIFDDPLSALDSHVGREVFKRAMSKKGLLRKKTRLLVTNQLQILPEVDHILYMADGRIRDQGTFDELLKSDVDFKKLMDEIISAQESKKYKAMDSTTITDYVAAKGPSLKKPSVVQGGGVMSMEERQTGGVKARVYGKYALLCGGLFMFSLSMAISIFAAALQVLANWWLTFWLQTETDRPNAYSMTFYLGIYFAFGVAYIIATFFRSTIFFNIALIAGTTMHTRALQNVLSAPMSFFDVTPIGRILSRFARDVAAADSQVPQQVLMLSNTLLSLIAAYIFIAIAIPLSMTIAIPVGIMYFLLQRFYNRTNIELKRLDSISKSPIYAHFSETLGGLSTIRAFNRQERFIDDNAKHIDANIRFFFAQIVTSRWFSFYLELLGSLLVLSVALFSVFGKTTIYSGIVGLSLNYALQVTSFLGFTIRSLTELESAMNSVERLMFYMTGLPHEAAAIVEDNRPKESWPESGKIEMDDVKLSYREGLELALTGVTCTVKAGEKIGVVGRTGAGKSSLIVALMRIVEPVGGSIVIDDVDVSKIGLEDLRSNLTIIPQDPVVFSGTIRFNLDPFSRHTDPELWDVLDKANMKEFVNASEGGLDAKVSEYGSNLSGGQKQLVCLARALLRHPKVLIMDEATSNVDYETDQIVQKTIRSEFNACTVITVAHRLWTIADYDRIMVVDAGKVKELDTPYNLLQDSDSVLTALVNALGETGAANFRKAVNRSSVHKTVS